MVKIRLARRGAKKRPYYHVVVSDSESPRDGKFLEQIGLYDPSRPDSEIVLDLDRAEYWMGVGAQPTGRAKKVINLVRRRPEQPEEPAEAPKAEAAPAEEPKAEAAPAEEPKAEAAEAAPAEEAPAEAEAPAEETAEA